MFAKLMDGVLVRAPQSLTVDGMVHYHPSEEMYLSLGWLPVIETEMPALDGNDPVYYESAWEERDGAIVRVWVEGIPPADEGTAPTVEDRVAALEEAMIEMMMGGMTGV